MKDSFRKLKFQDKEYILIGGVDDKDGAIATVEQYTQGQCSFAHLLPDGRIVKRKEQIGVIDDIEFGDTIEIELNNMQESISRLIDNFVGGKEGW